MTALLTADWCPYGKNGYFRKVEVYDMGWMGDINIDNVVIVAARFGGPIAVIRDRTKPGKIATKSMGKPVIAIYSAAGNLISSFVWNSGHLIKLGWSATEDLICVQENGEVLIYNMFGKYIHAFRMGQEVEDTKVIDAQVYYSSVGTGVCVLTGAYRLFFTNSIAEPKVRKVAEIPGAADLPNSWAVVCEERQTNILLSKSTEIFFMSESEVIQKSINFGSEDKLYIVTDIAISPCYKYVAMYNSQDQLWIGTSNLRTNFRHHNMQGSGRPKQFSWCGSEAVAGWWDENIVIIGRNGDCIDYFYDVPVKLIPEIDCVRVLSSFTTEIIQPVPKVVLETYRINSTSPGSYLLEASKQFNKKNHRANEYIHLVKEELISAINQCIEASSHEFSPENQKMLIRAANFGKTFAENYNSENYVRMCRTLRILNAVRNPRIGILLTYPQFEYLSFKNLLDRLKRRRHYYLAIKAADYMRLNDEDGSTSILEHWAHYKVSQGTDKEQVALDIANKLGHASGISYISIAKKAISLGRLTLAAKLIDFEPQPALQVSMLLSLDKYSQALEKAVQSGNTDLINIVIVKMSHLRKSLKMSREDFQLEIRRNVTVYALYKKYCEEFDKEALLNIYRQEDDNNEVAACHLKNAYDPKNFSSRTALLESAKESFKKAKNDTNMILCDEQRRLLTKQKELEDKFRREFVDLSLQDTIYRLLTLREVKTADEFRTLFRFPERKYWWLVIESIAELGKWSELERISKKKPILGYEPFVDVCLKYDNFEEANKYIDLVKDENKIKYLIKTKAFTKAIRIAEAARDIDALEYIRAHCDNSMLVDVNSALTRLTVPK